MSGKTRAIIITLAFMLAGTTVHAQSTARVIKGFSNPESVLIDGPRRFVSNIGEKLDPTGHDGDGFISALDETGKIVDLRAFPRDGSKLDAPKGMARLAGRLYVADIDRIVGFDLSTAKQVFEAHVPAGGPSLLNDITVVDSTLVVSDTLRGVVYDVDPGSGTFAVRAEAIPGANGIVWDAPGKRIIVVGLGAHFEGGDLFEIPLGEKPRKMEHGPHGILDGLALLPDGHLLISDWLSLDPPQPGRITLNSANGSTEKPLDLGLAIRGPADFAIDMAGGEIWIPALIDGEVVVAPLGL